MKSTFSWVKLTSLALLLHLVLIILSFAEVFLYSLLRPENDEAFYQAHAEVSAPYVSAIFGSLFIFLIVRWYIKHHTGDYLAYAVAFPAVYILIDLLIIWFFFEQSMDWLVFILANSVKVLASMLSYYVFRNRWQTIV